jgi:hypothetical protein
MTLTVLVSRHVLRVSLAPQSFPQLVDYTVSLAQRGCGSKAKDK